MKEKEYLLSICIPTYNRCKYLEKTMMSLLSCAELSTGEVEVIVCDNCSTDDTEEVVKNAMKSNKNIFYHKNNTNIGDKNFPRVLSLAHGSYLKLSNDRFCYYSDSLRFIIKKICDVDKNSILLFNNGDDSEIKGDLNTVMRNISFRITDIQTYGVWKNDFKYSISGCEKHLFQVENILSINEQKKNIVYISHPLGYIQMVNNKDMSYGLFNVFYYNYLEYFKRCLIQNRIDTNCYEFLKKDLLINFFVYYMAEYKLKTNKLLFSKDELFDKLVYETYKNEKYYQKYLVKEKYLYLKQAGKRIYEKFRNK